MLLGCYALIDKRNSSEVCAYPKLFLTLCLLPGPSLTKCIMCVTGGNTSWHNAAQKWLWVSQLCAKQTFILHTSFSSVRDINWIKLFHKHLIFFIAFCFKEFSCFSLRMKKSTAKYILQIYKVYSLSSNKNVTVNTCLGTFHVFQARKAWKQSQQQNDQEIQQFLPSVFQD